ncbi:MAG: hypothetical protein AB1Z98_03030 [Nannocystaceae bacterium]
MPASRCFVSPLVLASLLVTTACGKTEAAPVDHPPVSLDEAQAGTVARFVGTWQHSGGDEDREGSLAAVSTVTEQMNGLIAGMAQSKLEHAVRIDGTLEIREAEGIVTIVRSERPQPFVAPANGATFLTVNEGGDEANGSLRIVGQDLVTLIETDSGGGERTYRIDEAGQLQIHTRIFSPRLPAEVVFVTRYARS